MTGLQVNTIEVPKDGGVPAQVRYMQENEGFYICRHPQTPGQVPIISKGGRIYALNVDMEMDPQGFVDGLLLVGPIVAQAAEPDTAQTDDDEEATDDGEK